MPPSSLPSSTSTRVVQGAFDRRGHKLRFTVFARGKKGKPFSVQVGNPIRTSSARWYARPWLPRSPRRCPRKPKDKARPVTTPMPTRATAKAVGPDQETVSRHATTTCRRGSRSPTPPAKAPARADRRCRRAKRVARRGGRDDEKVCIRQDRRAGRRARASQERVRVRRMTPSRRSTREKRIKSLAARRRQVCVWQGRARMPRRMSRRIARRVLARTTPSLRSNAKSPRADDGGSASAKTAAQDRRGRRIARKLRARRTTPSPRLPRLPRRTTRRRIARRVRPDDDGSQACASRQGPARGGGRMSRTTTLRAVPRHSARLAGARSGPRREPRRIARRPGARRWRAAS